MRARAPRASGRFALTALAGGVAAATILSIPGGLLEIAAASSGLSELLPAAAPPLGVTARITLALGGALAVMGVAMAMQRPARSQLAHPQNAFIQAKDKKMGFAFSRLADFARGHRRGTGEALALARRPEDAHPDAPPRRPIFASQDFAGAEIFRRNPAVSPAVDPMAAHLADIIARPEVALAQVPLPQVPLPQAAPRQAIAPASAMPVAPVIPIAPARAEPAPVIAPRPAMVAPVAIAAAQPAPLHAPHIAPTTPVASAPLPRAPIAGLSLGELASRFERGLARRERSDAVAPVPLAPAPVVAPVPPIAVAPIAMVPVAVVSPAAIVDPQPARIPTLAELPRAEPVAIPPMLDADIDEALRAALGTLQKMVGRAR